MPQDADAEYDGYGPGDEEGQRQQVEAPEPEVFRSVDGKDQQHGEGGHDQGKPDDVIDEAVLDIGLATWGERAYRHQNERDDGDETKVGERRLQGEPAHEGQQGIVVGE